MKGIKRSANKINVILDTSGSMFGNFENVLSTVFRKGLEINLIEIDVKIQNVVTIRRLKQLKDLKIKGLGGTSLQPAIDLVVSKYNNYPTMMLTDGYVDKLDFSKCKKNSLVISVGKEPDIIGNNTKIITLPSNRRFRRII